MSAQQMASCNSEMTAPGPCQHRNRDSTSNAKHAQLEDAVHSVRVFRSRKNSRKPSTVSTHNEYHSCRYVRSTVRCMAICDPCI